MAHERVKVYNIIVSQQSEAN